MAHGRRGGRASFGWRFWLGGTLALLLASLVGLALAGEAEGWRVGRIAATQGGVWLLDRTPGAPDASDTPGSPGSPDAPETGRWHDSRTEALTHWPLGRDDLVRTGPDGRAVLQIDQLTLRLGADTELRIEALDAARVVLWLPRGELALHVLAEPAPRAIELRTPEGRLWPLRAGHYRASRVPELTRATAWIGVWRFDADDSALTVAEGQRADFWRQGRPARTHYAWASVTRDDFADWARLDAQGDLPPPGALPPDLAAVPGAGELQRWGDWQDDEQAGRLWLPRELPPGWAPYRDGRWAWIAPWGWTWIVAAPWGFTPFHHGQWLLIRGRWAWAPGPRVERHRDGPVSPGWDHRVPRVEPPRRPPRPDPPRVSPPRPDLPPDPGPRPRVDRPVPPPVQQPRPEPRAEPAARWPGPAPRDEREPRRGEGRLPRNLP